ncbi:unnamed protein product [Ranitomeya imitator]|uniref:Uncharacterized protein n=1 Tax=Ranitomeya imitator TaxID=111125 RepID=A0ABN9LL71_9NEOB|nr:unnamed protein product [Ranitomeya imitator]
MTSRSCDRDVITGPAFIPTLGLEAAACTAHRRQDFKRPLEEPVPLCTRCESAECEAEFNVSLLSESAFINDQTEATCAMTVSLFLAVLSYCSSSCSSLVFWQLGGCGILGVGIWLAVTQGNFATLSSSFPSLSAANLLIATGTIVMIVGFLGCIGAIKENKYLLLSFFILLLIIFLLEFIVVTLFFIYTDKEKWSKLQKNKTKQCFQTSNNAKKTSSESFRNNNTNVLTCEEIRNQYFVE